MSHSSSSLEITEATLKKLLESPLVTVMYYIFCIW